MEDVRVDVRLLDCQVRSDDARELARGPGRNGKHPAFKAERVGHCLATGYCDAWPRKKVERAFAPPDGKAAPTDARAGDRVLAARKRKHAIAEVEKQQGIVVHLDVDDLIAPDPLWQANRGHPGDPFDWAKNAGQGVERVDGHVVHRPAAALVVPGRIDRLAHPLPPSTPLHPLSP